MAAQTGGSRRSSCSGMRAIGEENDLLLGRLGTREEG